MIYLVLTTTAILARLLPHPANVAPIGGLALFVGWYASAVATSKRQQLGSILLPLLALFLSDMFIGFYQPLIMATVYFGFVATIFLGAWVGKERNISRIIIASLLGSVFFYLLTNAAVWAFTPLYSKTLAGLAESYIAAIPFFRNSLFGDLFYTGVLFGSYQLARLSLRKPQLVKTSASMLR